MTRSSQSVSALMVALAFLSLLLSGAIFGFFYAWVCSTMWGLDRLDPRSAIEAMQAMNASVRNAVFGPVFFGTPIVLAVTALSTWRAGHPAATALFATAGLVCLIGAVLLTTAVNVPMNEALATQAPQTIDEAATVWQAYSPRWQAFNVGRTFAMGLAVLLTGLGLLALPPAIRA